MKKLVLAVTMFVFSLGTVFADELTLTSTNSTDWSLATVASGGLGAQYTPGNFGNFDYSNYANWDFSRQVISLDGGLFNAPYAPVVDGNANITGEVTGYNFGWGTGNWITAAQPGLVATAPSVDQVDLYVTTKLNQLKSFNAEGWGDGFRDAYFTGTAAGVASSFALEGYRVTETTTSTAAALNTVTVGGKTYTPISAGNDACQWGTVDKLGTDVANAMVQAGALVYADRNGTWTNVSTSGDLSGGTVFWKACDITTTTNPASFTYNGTSYGPNSPGSEWWGYATRFEAGAIDALMQEPGARIRYDDGSAWQQIEGKDYAGLTPAQKAACANGEVWWKATETTTSATLATFTYSNAGVDTTYTPATAGDSFWGYANNLGPEAVAALVAVGARINGTTNGGEIWMAPCNITSTTTTIPGTTVDEAYELYKVQAAKECADNYGGFTFDGFDEGGIYAYKTFFDAIEGIYNVGLDASMMYDDHIVGFILNGVEMEFRSTVNQSGVAAWQNPIAVSGLFRDVELRETGNELIFLIANNQQALYGESYFMNPTGWAGSIDLRYNMTPEPATFVMFGIGLCGLGLARRFRRK